MSNKKIKSLSGIVYSTDSNFKVEQEEYEDETTFLHEQQSLKVSLEKKQRSGKTVTLITGYKGQQIDLEELGRQLKSFCGTGGSVKEGNIVVQGDNREKVLKWLQSNGYKMAKLI